MLSENYTLVSLAAKRFTGAYLVPALGTIWGQCGPTFSIEY
jgi:hypothetical protein